MWHLTCAKWRAVVTLLLIVVMAASGCRRTRKRIMREVEDSVVDHAVEKIEDQVVEPKP